MKHWCKVFPFLNVYQNFFLFQKSSECWMFVSLQECNKLIKTPAKSVLLTEKKKKAGISFFGYLFCSFLRLKAENSQPKVPAQRLAEHISWNNFGKVVTYGLSVISLHKRCNTWQDDVEVLLFFSLFYDVIWRTWRGKEINCAVYSSHLSDEMLIFYTIALFLFHCFSLFHPQAPGNTFSLLQIVCTPSITFTGCQT